MKSPPPPILSCSPPYFLKPTCTTGCRQGLVKHNIKESAVVGDTRHFILHSILYLSGKGIVCTFFLQHMQQNLEWQHLPVRCGGGTHPISQRPFVKALLLPFPLLFLFLPDSRSPLPLPNRPRCWRRRRKEKAINVSHSDDIWIHRRLRKVKRRRMNWIEKKWWW